MDLTTDHTRDHRELPLDALTRPAWQRRDLLLVLLHERCAACDEVARALEPLPARLRDPELRVVVVRGAAGAGAKVSLGVDAREAAVVVADRFLHVFAILQIHGRPAAALVEELAGWAESVALQCGECSRS